MALNPTEQAILTVIQSDIASIAGQPLITLLNALKASNGNIALQQAAILQFIGEAPALGLQLGIEFETQAINWAIAKLQAYLAKPT
jgi:hypothetical protein